jgi:hypothetical protein
MRPRPDRPLTLREHFGSPAIWFAFLGGPLAWVAHFLATYGSVSLACDEGANGLLYLTTIIAAPVAIAAGVVAWRLWQQPAPRNGEPVVKDEGTALRVTARTRFFGFAGMLMSAIFLLAILAEGAAPLMLDPCGSGA